MRGSQRLARQLPAKLSLLVFDAKALYAVSLTGPLFLETPKSSRNKKLWRLIDMEDIQKLNDKRMVVRNYIRAHSNCTYFDIKRDTKIKVKRIYKNMKDAYEDAGVAFSKNLTKRNVMEQKREVIIFIRNNPNCSVIDIQKQIRVNVGRVFGGIANAYKEADVIRSETRNYKIESIGIKYTPELAEIMGIILGDGGLYALRRNKFCTTVVFNKLERQYAEYVKSLFEKHFYPYKFYIFEAPHTFMLSNGSIYVGKYLLEAGMRLGDKIRSGVTTPEWIFKKNLLKYFIRGMFDTDGCVYRKYDNFAQIEFKLGSDPLIFSLRRALINLNFNPTEIKWHFHSKGGARINWQFCLSRQSEVKRFFEEIQPKNKKHLIRFDKIWGRRESRQPLLAASDPNPSVSSIHRL